MASNSKCTSTGITSCLTSKAKRRKDRANEYSISTRGGNLIAVRWNDWKVSFAAASEGNIATATREVTSWAMITNLRMDPYERGLKEGGEAMKFFAQQIWLLVPIQQQIKEFFSDFDQYPFQTGSTLNPSGIGYGMLQKEPPWTG